MVPLDNNPIVGEVSVGGSFRMWGEERCNKNSETRVKK